MRKPHAMSVVMVAIMSLALSGCWDTTKTWNVTRPDTTIVVRPGMPRPLRTSLPEATASIGATGRFVAVEYTGIYNDAKVAAVNFDPAVPFVQVEANVAETPQTRLQYSVYYALGDSTLGGHAYVYNPVGEAFGWVALGEGDTLFVGQGDICSGLRMTGCDAAAAGNYAETTESWIKLADGRVFPINNGKIPASGVAGKYTWDSAITLQAPGQVTNVGLSIRWQDRVKRTSPPRRWEYVDRGVDVGVSSIEDCVLASTDLAARIGVPDNTLWVDGDTVRGRFYNLTQIYGPIKFYVAISGTPAASGCVTCPPGVQAEYVVPSESVVQAWPQGGRYLEVSFPVAEVGGLTQFFYTAVSLLASEERLVDSGLVEDAPRGRR